MSETLLKVEHLSKSFRRPTGEKLTLWHDVSFTLEASQFMAVCGESGSGKSTLLFTLGGLESPDDGRITFQGKPVCCTSNAHIPGIAYIFQHYHLIEELSVLENVLLPLQVGGRRDQTGSKRAQALLTELHLEPFIHSLPRTLSGGERQRVAIARALVMQPKLILADEPTGSLDEQTSQHVIDLFLSACETHKTSFILVTHNERFAQQTQRYYRLEQSVLKKVSVPSRRF